MGESCSVVDEVENERVGVRCEECQDIASGWTISKR